MSSSDLDLNNGSEPGSEYEYDIFSDDEYPQEGSIGHDEQQHSLFNQEPIACPVCCDDKVEEGCALTLPSCSHSFCTDCFASYVEAQIGQGNADSITCPFILDDGGMMIGSQCNAPVEMNVLQEIMTKESFDRLKYQRDAAFVRKNVDYHHCPFPDCTNIVLCKSVGDGGVDADDTKIAPPAAKICDCFKCGNTSCLTCMAMPFHFSKTCDEYREEKAQLKRQREREREHEAILARMRQGICPTMRPELDRSRAEETVRFDFNLDDNDTSGDAFKNVKRCGRCGNGVERESGCMKMKCICGYRFCYQCGMENAMCGCTPSHHGFIDNNTGRSDFSGLTDVKSYT